MRILSGVNIAIFILLLMYSATQVCPLFQSNDTHEKVTVLTKVQNVSVTLETGKGGAGSGVIYTRKLPSGQTQSYVWTAEHVVRNDEDGTLKVIQELRGTNGKPVGKWNCKADVIYKSKKLDIAVLKLQKKNILPASKTVEFDISEKPPKIDTEVYHVGSYYGMRGHNNVARGTITRTGRKLYNYKGRGRFRQKTQEWAWYDKVSISGLPGSSGGGVFHRESGKCLGLLTRMWSNSVGAMVPARTIVDFCKQHDEERLVNIKSRPETK